MTIEQIINTLKQSGVNSKKQVIEMLTNATEKDLCELARDCNTKIAEKHVKGVDDL